MDPVSCRDRNSALCTLDSALVSYERSHAHE